jgi:calcineurin-like phosphoesterase family protein
MNIWFTADEHYDHENARTGWGRPELARPFSSREEMQEALVARHNAVARAGDVTYHLGDMFWRTMSPDDAVAVVRRLNGAHCYVMGNHEELMHSLLVRSQFRQVEVRTELRLRHATYNKGVEPAALHLVLDHYAGRAWNGSSRGSWQLHSHSHGALPDIGLMQMDVSVDCNNFAPVSLDQVVEHMRKKGASK